MTPEEISMMNRFTSYMLDQIAIKEFIIDFRTKGQSSPRVWEAAKALRLSTDRVYSIVEDHDGLDFIVAFKQGGVVYDISDENDYQIVLVEGYED